MFNGKKILALIPARGGSKGLPGKNILLLAGKPLIAWTIEAAKECSYIDKLIVSTDDEEIAMISLNYGAEIPFMRPAEFASDSAKSTDVILHAIDLYEKKKMQFDLLLYLQPTSPLRSTEDINKGIESLFEKGVKSVVSVCETEHHPFWSNTLPEDLSMKNFINPEYQNSNRQDLPKYYRINGAFYFSEIEYFKQNIGFLGNNTIAYIMPQERSIDIDNIIDFKLAEILLFKYKEIL